MSIGIDFGTSLNKIGSCDNVGFRVVTNNYKNTSTPSVAFLNHKDRWFFGEKALKNGISKPKRFINELKMMIGQNYNDKQFDSCLNDWKFQIEKQQESIKIVINVDGEKLEFIPYDVVGLILKNLIEITKSNLPLNIYKTVISIPANFNEKQKSDLFKAAQLANLPNTQLEIEPILSSIAYLFNAGLNPSEKRNILVYSFGFSNPEISIIKIHPPSYEIESKIDYQINGRQFDDNVLNYINKKMLKKYPQKNEFLQKPQTQAKLRIACEEAKIALSGIETADVIIEDDEDEEENQLFVSISYEKFNKLNEELFDKSMDAVKTFIKEVKIDELFLVGGMTYMKKIREKLIEITGKKPCTFADPCEAPTLGACIYGAYLIKDQFQSSIVTKNQTFFEGLKVFENQQKNEPIECKLMINEANKEQINQCYRQRIYKKYRNEQNINTPLLQELDFIEEDLHKPKKRKGRIACTIITIVVIIILAAILAVSIFFLYLYE